MLEQGYVQVYTGNGKGKTTAMLGLALRAVGAGLRVYIGQFVKDTESSETKAIKKFLPNIEIEQYGPNGLIEPENMAEAIQTTLRGLEKATNAMLSGKYDAIMLDEINIAVYMGVLKTEHVLELIRKKPHNVELVLTGRYAPAEVIAAADLVSEIGEVKHYYEAGVGVRTGIEE